jgi:SEC-C motif-containing protein
MRDCPCTSGNDYDSCCGPFLAGEAQPETALQLMRSRYTAFTEKNLEYVVATHDPATRDEVDEEATRRWIDEAEWEGLTVVSTEAGEAGDDSGRVRFVAEFHQDRKHQSHKEDASFRRIDGRWFYADSRFGFDPVRREEPKLRRNAPCPCGSGRKHKLCHGAKGR